MPYMEWWYLMSAALCFLVGACVGFGLARPERRQHETQTVPGQKEDMRSLGLFDD